MIFAWPTARPIRGEKTVNTYRYTFIKLAKQFGAREVESITTEEVFSFLAALSDGNKPSTKKNRFGQVRGFFHFVRQTTHNSFPNPCDAPVLRKLFRCHRLPSRDILEKEAVDEMIFRTEDTQSRLVLELMARGGMRVGEVLKLRAKDVQGTKLNLVAPKSKREGEVVFIPKKVADRLEKYILKHRIKSEGLMFPMCYSIVRSIVVRAGKMVGVEMAPHDLRRHAAIYASRSGTPIEIISKVILRHSNLSTTQRYLGKVSEVEAMRWIEDLYG
ncbi:MAG: site-specific integrase [Thermodesulfobacteriota bacterium]